MLVYHVHFKNV